MTLEQIDTCLEELSDALLQTYSRPDLMAVTVARCAQIEADALRIARAAKNAQHAYLRH